MYLNYGDVDFFEHGRLVDDQSSDTEIKILACEPYSDTEDLYQFGNCVVDFTDTWIDRDAVMTFIGMTEEDFDPVRFALGCMDYYSWDNFGADHYFAYNWLRMKKESICEILKHQQISSENLNITW